MTEPYGIATFCDDIREEISGKYSLIGVYGGEMVIASAQPVVIPIFCMSVQICIPIAIKIEQVSIEAKLVVDGVETDLMQGGIDTPPQPSESDLVDKDLLKVVMNFRMSGILIQKTSRISARSFINNELVNLGSLPIRFIDPPA